MSKPTALAIAGPNFWTSAASNIGFHSDGDLLYVVLDDTAKMEVVLRSKGQMFTAAAAAAGARGLRVVVNANMYDISWGPLVGIAFGAGKPLDPAVITPIGRVVSASRTTGRSAPSLFYVAYKPGYEFGFGDPATAGMAAAVGGLGPIILNGLKYGTGNKYKPGTAAGAPATGEPPPQFKADMIQRNNNTYAAAAKLSRATGKAAIAHSAAAKKLLIAVQPHGGTGVSHDDLRDKLAGVGVENAVFLDGSDSVLLQVDGVLHVRPAKAKDQTNSVGIGFRT